MNARKRNIIAFGGFAVAVLEGLGDSRPAKYIGPAIEAANRLASAFDGEQLDSRVMATVARKIGTVVARNVGSLGDRPVALSALLAIAEQLLGYNHEVDTLIDSLIDNINHWLWARHRVSRLYRDKMATARGIVRDWEYA